MPRGAQCTFINLNCGLAHKTTTKTKNFLQLFPYHLKAFSGIKTRKVRNLSVVTSLNQLPVNLLFWKWCVVGEEVNVSHGHQYDILVFFQHF